jgi:hypothetical protein
MRRLALAAAAATALTVPALALAAQTKDFNFQSTGNANQPGAVTGLGSPGSYDDFPFTIAPGDQDGSVTVGIHWGNPADDWDLYVYRRNGSGGLDQVASSAQGTTTDEQAVIQAQDGPVVAGSYVIRVQNYASSNPNFTGVTKFAPFVQPNLAPKARLKAPKRTTAGKKVLIDASGSKDSDGKIVKYAFDLDGNGTMETVTGSSPKVRRAFKYGLRHIAVRVVDDRGGRSYANATIAVAKKPKKKK